MSTDDAIDKHTFATCSFYTSSSHLPPTVTSIVSAAFGANHTVVLCENADVTPPERCIWGTGDGTRGQLGTGIEMEVRRFRRLRVGDHVFKGQYDKGGDIVHIGACWATTYIVCRPTGSPVGLSRTSDILVSVGANDFGELGAAQSSAITIVSFANAIHASGLVPSSPPPVFRVERLATGLHHVIVVLHIALIDGSIHEIIVGWGASRNGQLEIHQHEEFDAAQIASSASMKPVKQPTRKSNGTAAFLNTPTHLYTVPGDEKVLSMALGQQHSVILIQKKDGSTKVLCGGSNRKGQLGFTSEIITMPLRSVDCTWNGTYFETSSEPGDAGGEGGFSILAAGSGEMGQLGRGIARTTAHPLPGPSVTVGFNVSVSPAPASSRAVNSQVIFPALIQKARLDSLVCGSEHVVATLSYESEERGDTAGTVEREAWAWGWNEHGNLGLGHTEDVPIPTRIWPPSINIKTSSNLAAGGRLRKAWAGNGTTLLLID